MVFAQELLLSLSGSKRIWGCETMARLSRKASEKIYELMTFQMDFEG